MISILFVFVVSIIICCFLAYILGMFWFSDARNRRMLSFYLLGIEIFIWTLLNAITMITDPEFFPVIYTMRMVMVCIVPFGAAWFILDFTSFPLRKKAWLRNIFIIIPAVDVLLMLTNPLHYLYFTDYAYPMPGRAPIFWAHTGIDFVFIIIAFIILIRFIVKGVRRNPLLILTGVGMMFPYALNVTYSFGLTQFPYDTTPIGFFVTFLLFVYVSMRLQLFTVKTALFSSTMDSIDDLIVIFNQRLTIIDANISAVNVFSDFNIVLGSSKGEDFFDYLKSITEDEKIDDLIGSLKENHDVDGEFTLKLPNEEVKNYTVRWRAVYEGDRKTGYIMILLDVSNYRVMISEINKKNNELIDLTEKAEMANHSKSVFLANMSHEIRTPMNAIIGMTTIAKSTEDPKRIKNALQKIEGAATHLLGIINDILDMSKIEADKLELSPVRFNIEEMLQRIIGIINFSVGEKKQKFIAEIDENIPRHLIGDEQRLSQVITNLLSNAVKFTPEDGTIRFEAVLLKEFENDCLIEILVSDTGVGISLEQQKRLFVPFGQAENSTTRKFGGTGLGLAISKRIVKMMNGIIWVESEPGEGSTFSFTMWAGKAKEEEGNICAEGDTCDIVPDGSFKDFSVLLAEDVEINREIVITLLEPTLINIDCAENGRIACEMFENDPDKYDLIFMDIQMPVMDGYEATRCIRALDLPQAKTVPIIAMTANVFKEDIEKCLVVGMNDHIGKPLDMDEVMKTLQKYLKT